MKSSIQKVITGAPKFDFKSIGFFIINY